MSDREDELSEDELESLLADLESRAEEGDGGSSGAELDDDEDLEALLNEADAREAAESDQQEARPTATAEQDDELDARLEQFDDLQPDDLPERPEETAAAKRGDQKSRKEEKKNKKEKKKAKKEARDKEKAEGPSPGARFARYALRVLAVVVPVAALMWVSGAYLGNWVSAAWLIVAMTAVLALGVPAMLRHLVGRGKFRWWAVGFGLVATVAMVAPVPNQAGESLSEYGHWPASALGELTGAEADTPFIRANAGVAAAIGGLLHTGSEEPAPQRLGTDDPLAGDQDADSASEEPADGDEGQDTADDQNGDEPSPDEEATDE